VPSLALKIDVDTLAGTVHGVPRLAELLSARDAGATFLFSLGPDHTGRAIKRLFRHGFLAKVRRTSVATHYGFPTLLYGTLLPGPDIGRRCRELMRQIRDRGFETGIHTWDHVKWQDGVAQADEDWTARQMHKAIARYREIFDTAPAVHAAAGWQMNRAALRLTERLGFQYCSDGRGSEPHIPVVKAEIINCPQIPTTLPTLDELIGNGGVTEANVAEHLLELTRVPRDHVFTLHAELEGRRLAPVFERLLAGWQAQGYALTSLGGLLAAQAGRPLPYFEAETGSVPGRSGTLLVQGKRFLH
jgi:peptidoglycan/xylan/chitin deacetylase (PgdA/CDA1 family)